MTSQTSNKQTHYDVVIPGGGLAGLTLSIQIKRANPEISVLVLERRDDSAATAALRPTMECQTVTCVVGNFGGTVGSTLAGAQSAARVQV